MDLAIKFSVVVLASEQMFLKGFIVFRAQIL